MIYYIYTASETAFIEKAKEHLKEEEITYLSFDALDSFDVRFASHLLVTGCLAEIKQILAIAQQNNLTVGIVPTSKQKELIRTLDLSAKLEEAIALALTPSEKPIDVLYANGTLVLQEVVVGDVPPLDEFSTALNGKSYWDRVKIFFTTLKK